MPSTAASTGSLLPATREGVIGVQRPTFGGGVRCADRLSGPVKSPVHADRADRPSSVVKRNSMPLGITMKKAIQAALVAVLAFTAVQAVTHAIAEPRLPPPADQRGAASESGPAPVAAPSYWADVLADGF
ncbi:MAG: hypothetical protein ABW194_02185 [Novosphingobium sp.]